MALSPAARLGDPSDHGGSIVSASSTVFADMIGRARNGDSHSCPIPGHGVTALISGSSGVYVDGLLVIRVGDKAGCGAAISSGSPTVSSS